MSGSPHTITATLTADAKAALEAVDGLGFDGYDPERAAGTVDDPYDPSADTTTSANAADAIDIAAGFIVDDAGNAATTDVSDATSITYTETSTDGDQA